MRRTLESRLFQCCIWVLLGMVVVGFVGLMVWMFGHLAGAWG